MKRNIIISIPLVWGIRNFVLSGIAQSLVKEYKIFYAIPEVGKGYMKRLGVSEDSLIILKSQQYTRLQRWCSSILHKSHRKRFPTASDVVFKPIIEPAKKTLRHHIINVASIIFKRPIFYNLLERVEQFLFMQRIDLELEKRVEAINPIFAISTSYVVNTEWSLFRLLHARQVKIVTHILSFDNLTSRGYLPIKFFDKFLVWNAKMARELRTIYNIPDEQISITGTPQFDFHANPQYLKSFDWTTSQLGIEQKPYLLYCANHYALTPDEPKLVEQIVTALQQNSILQPYTIVLRLHPMDDYGRWASLLNDFPMVRVSYPWAHLDEDNLYWGEPSVDDLVLFSNTLRYCSLVFNIASTISIDAAILDRPVVCVGFSSDPANSLNSLYYNFHYSDHYASIMKIGATPISADLKSLIELSLVAIHQPQNLADKRKEMVEFLCGEIDGQSSEKIINFVYEFGK